MGSNVCNGNVPSVHLLGIYINKHTIGLPDSDDIHPFALFEKGIALFNVFGELAGLLVVTIQPELYLGNLGMDSTANFHQIIVLPHCPSTLSGHTPSNSFSDMVGTAICFPCVLIKRITGLRTLCDALVGSATVDEHLILIIHDSHVQQINLGS